MKSDLTPEMQERLDSWKKRVPENQEILDKWKKNVLGALSNSVRKAKSPGNYISRSRDYGDDLNEFEEFKIQIMKGK